MEEKEKYSLYNKEMTVTYQQIINATNNYTKKLHEYDMSLIITKMVEDYKLQDQVYVFPYPGTLPITNTTWAYDIFAYETNLGKFADLWNPNTAYRYNIGIFSIPMTGDQEHYMALVINNRNNEIIIWDSLAENSNEFKNELNIFRQIYSNYVVYGLDICSGSCTYQTQNRWYEQNIFCHTWSLFFVDQFLYALSLGKDTSVIIRVLEGSCGYEKDNLITIKTFAKHLSLNYLEYKPQKAFDYILNVNRYPLAVEPIMEGDIHWVWNSKENENFIDGYDESDVVDLDESSSTPENLYEKYGW